MAEDAGPDADPGTAFGKPALAPEMQEVDSSKALESWMVPLVLLHQQAVVFIFVRPLAPSPGACGQGS